MIREKFETVISVPKHCNPCGQKLDDVLFDETLDSESGNLGFSLNFAIKKLYVIQQIVTGCVSIFSTTI